MPEALPAGLTIRFATWEATNRSEGAPKEGQGHGVGVGVSTVGDNLDEDALHDLASQQVRGGPRQVAQLQQPHGENRQKGQQAPQPLGVLKLTVLHGTAGFQATVVFFNNPAAAIPIDALQSVLKAEHGDRSQQQPFYRLDTLWRRGFPGAHDPSAQRGWLPWTIGRRAQGDFLPTDSEVGSPGCLPRVCGDIETARPPPPPKPRLAN